MIKTAKNQKTVSRDNMPNSGQFRHLAEMFSKNCRKTAVKKHIKLSQVNKKWIYGSFTAVLRQFFGIYGSFQHKNFLRGGTRVFPYILDGYRGEKRTLPEESA